jgi:hypothetical protein
VAAVLWAAPSSASLVTINFQGAWTFNDFEWKFLGCEVLPEQCAFVQGLAAIGVVDQSIVSFSLTLDTRVLDSDPSTTVGSYQHAATGVVTLGSRQYSLGPSNVLVSPDQPCAGGVCPGSLNFFRSSFTGPALSGNGLILVPSLFQFDLFGPGFSSDSLSGIDFAGLGASMVVGFSQPGSGGRNIGRVNLQSGGGSSIPEPHSIVLVSSALVAFGLQRMRSRRPTPSNPA